MKKKKRKKERKKEEEEFRLDLNDFGLICAGINNIGGYKRKACYNSSCLLQTYCHLSTSGKLSVSWPYSEINGVINYGSGWGKVS